MRLPPPEPLLFVHIRLSSPSRAKAETDLSSLVLFNGTVSIYGNVGYLALECVLACVPWASSHVSRPAEDRMLRVPEDNSSAKGTTRAEQGISGHNNPSLQFPSEKGQGQRDLWLQS